MDNEANDDEHEVEESSRDLYEPPAESLRELGLIRVKALRQSLLDGLKGPVGRGALMVEPDGQLFVGSTPTPGSASGDDASDEDEAAASF